MRGTQQARAERAWETSGPRAAIGRAWERPVDLLHLVGRTPLLRLRRIASEFDGVEIYAKAEWYNPGGSVKDRAGLWIIQEAEATGRLTPEKIILDATSGNTGIAYAWIARVKGYRVTLALPANVTPERKRILRALGAELHFTDPREGSDGAIREARRLAAERPELYFYADQYNNPANWRAHYETTAVEIFEQTEGRITHFVAGLGTSGTFVGVGRRLRELCPEIRLISVQPDAPFHGIEGLKHMPTALRPGIYDEALADLNLEISTEEAYAMVRRLAREEGVLVGVSSGAALAGALRVARAIRRGVIVTVFPDGGEKYLSERFWEEWGDDPTHDRAA